MSTTNTTGNRVLVGDGSWFFTAEVDGDDIVVRNVKSTRWGGADDAEDGGMSASGLSTVAHPEYQGVSLPMRIPGATGALLKAIGGSPLPKFPWYTPVKVYSHKTNTSLFGHLIDIGPAKWTGHALDMTNSLVQALGLPLSDGVYDVDYRVIGGAKFVVG